MVPKSVISTGVNRTSIFLVTSAAVLARFVGDMSASASAVELLECFPDMGRPAQSAALCEQRQPQAA